MRGNASSSRVLPSSGFCNKCLRGVGRSQPSILADSQIAPASGACVWSANLAEPPLCSAATPRVSRICPCRPSSTAEVAPSAAPQAALLEAQAQELLGPQTQVDSSLPPGRCGGAFGNRLSTKCASAGEWCCSASMQCGASPAYCEDSAAHCKPSELTFCGAGWTLRLTELGFYAPGDR